MGPLFQAVVLLLSRPRRATFKPAFYEQIEASAAIGGDGGSSQRSQ